MFKGYSPSIQKVINLSFITLKESNKTLRQKTIYAILILVTFVEIFRRENDPFKPNLSCKNAIITDEILVYR